MPTTAALSDTTVIITMSTVSISKYSFYIYTSMQLLQLFPLFFVLRQQLLLWPARAKMWKALVKNCCIKWRTGRKANKKTHFASSSLAMRRRMWLVAEAALKTSTALQNRVKTLQLTKLIWGFKKQSTARVNWLPFACDSDETVSVHLQNLVPWHQVSWNDRNEMKFIWTPMRKTNEWRIA